MDVSVNEVLPPVESQAMGGTASASKDTPPVAGAPAETDHTGDKGKGKGPALGKVIEDMQREARDQEQKRLLLDEQCRKEQEASRIRFQELETNVSSVVAEIRAINYALTNIKTEAEAHRLEALTAAKANPKLMMDMLASIRGGAPPPTIPAAGSSAATWPVAGPVHPGTRQGDVR